MSETFVTAYYVDAQDGRPATEAPLRHGPAKPSEALVIDAVDRRRKPALIIGRIPENEPLAGGMTQIGEQEHREHVAAIQQWRDDLDAQWLRDAKQKAVKRINEGYQAELDAILHDYPEAETKTWDKQESEARAWQADNTAPTPLIDEIALARSMDKAELVSRIIAKADAWTRLSGSATGKRQRLEDAIAAATASQEVGDIQW